MAPHLLLFDSGIGGLSVAREVGKLLPTAEMVYVADDAAFPYGDWADAALSEHVVGLVARLVDRFVPDAVVIACNTASTLVLPPLRERFQLPFVGTVPAIKPAAERTKSGLISVLATYGTMRRDYTRELIAKFAGGSHVRLVGSANLAPLAEAHVRGEAIDDAAVLSEIAPAFLEQDGKRTDMIVLACTHYPFLIDRLARVAPWPVEWIDPAPAIARRVLAVVGENAGSRDSAHRGSAWLSSGEPWPEKLRPLLAAIGLEPAGSIWQSSQRAAGDTI
jgi:glutamate racemase